MKVNKFAGAFMRLFNKKKPYKITPVPKGGGFEKLLHPAQPSTPFHGRVSTVAMRRSRRYA